MGLYKLILEHRISYLWSKRGLMSEHFYYYSATENGEASCGSDKTKEDMKGLLDL